MKRPAFEDLYRRELPAVFRTAYLMTGDTQEASDLAQEAFARAYERWGAVQKADNPAAWLQRVTSNLAISSRRRAKVRRRFVDAIAPQAAPPPQLPDPELLDALKKLTDSQRVVIVLRFYADRSIDEVAEALGKRPGTVTALTSQGLARLRLHLGERVNDEA